LNHPVYRQIVSERGYNLSMPTWSSCRLSSLAGWETPLFMPSSISSGLRHSSSLTFVIMCDNDHSDPVLTRPYWPLRFVWQFILESVTVATLYCQLRNNVTSCQQQQQQNR